MLSNQTMRSIPEVFVSEGTGKPHLIRSKKLSINPLESI